MIARARPGRSTPHRTKESHALLSPPCGVRTGRRRRGAHRTRGRSCRRPGPRATWSARVTINLDAGRLGLGAGAPRSALALAGARRAAAKIGVNRQSSGASSAFLGARGRHPSAPDGRRLARALEPARRAHRRPQGHVGRRHARPAALTEARGAVNVRGSRAVRIARTRIAGPDTAGAPQLVAYAGDPGRPRAPRRAWVVAVDPAHTEAGDNSPMPLCVVVDAQTGRVLKVWKGSVTAADAPRDAQARAAAGTTVLAQVRGRQGPLLSSSSSALGNRRLRPAHQRRSLRHLRHHGRLLRHPWRSRAPGRDDARKADVADARADRRDHQRRAVLLPRLGAVWCGRNGGRPGLAPGYHRWFFTINWTGPISKFVASQERIYLQRGNPSIDEQVHSHEIGHRSTTSRATTSKRRTKGTRSRRRWRRFLLHLLRLPAGPPGRVLRARSS